MSRISPGALRADARKASYWRDSTGVEMSHGQDAGIPKWLAGTLMDAVCEISRIRNLTVKNVMMNRLAAGVEVPKHSDETLERYERWHLPITTNPDALWWDADGATHMEVGRWFGPVRFWEPHFVSNKGREERVHLIVDLAE